MYFLRISLLLIAASIVGFVPPIYAENFVAPISGQLYIQCVGGDAGAVSSFGTGTSPGDFVPFLTGLPGSSPSAEVLVRTVSAGEIVSFGMSTRWGDQTYFAFSNAKDPASVTAFSDMDNSLKMGGRTIEQTSANTWIMHLDDAASYLFDDDDNDVLIRIRIVQNQPVTILQAAPGRIQESRIFDSAAEAIYSDSRGSESPGFRRRDALRIVGNTFLRPSMNT